MLQYRNIIIIFIISLMAIAGLFVLTDIYLNIRFNELKLYLQESNRDESNIDHIQLITRYNISRRLYRNLISADDADAVESRINALTAERAAYETVFFTKYKYVSIPALFVINLNRFFMGKNPIEFRKDEKASALLESAVYFERNNIYQRALEYYEKLIDEGKTGRQARGSVLLHQGFCHAVMGSTAKAKILYNRIIGEYAGEGIAVTAAALLNYLLQNDNDQRMVADGEPESLAKAEQLFNLMAYKKALKIFESLEESAAGQDRVKINFYRARCYDELGMKERSVNSYLNIIADNPDSKYAKLSNRRLYMIGSKSGRGNSVEKLAVNINMKYRDPVMESIINNKSLFMSETGRDDIIKNIKIDDKFVQSLRKISSGNDELTYINKRVRVSTNDGSIFMGTVAGTNDNEIIIKSSIGTVVLKKSAILKIQRINE